ncbi:hypothetical protein [Methylocystis sp. ATCC 49242]|uniref:hypothetical protein n=1 Tax=Methylocystis sp. ATCC 49242 TaxID=622637 RepID=UPI0001F87DE1|nr:hypothetical protein [Methylocystis sp. ATCC 49242]
MCRPTPALAGRRGDQPNEMTIRGATEFQSAAQFKAAKARAREAKVHRSVGPGEETFRFFACHGRGHEIVKKPFATPEGGEYASQPARAAHDVKTAVPKIR